MKLGWTSQVDVSNCISNPFGFGFGFCLDMGLGEEDAWFWFYEKVGNQDDNTEGYTEGLDGFWSGDSVLPDIVCNREDILE